MCNALWESAKEANSQKVTPRRPQEGRASVKPAGRRAAEALTVGPVR